MRFARMVSLGLAVAAVVPAGCASMPAKEATDAKRVCINRGAIDSIGALDDQHAFVKVGAARYYLFTTEKTCQGLKFARGFAIEASTSRVCGDGVSFLSFNDAAVGPTRCRIEQIDSVADRAAALELIESRASRE